MSKAKPATAPKAKITADRLLAEPEARRSKGARSKKTEEKRRAILVAAAKVFKEKGYFEASLADIGKEAGTFAGSLYYHFESKNAIADEVLQYGTTGVTEVVRASAEIPLAATYRERLQEALTTHLTQMMLKDDFIVAYWKLIDQVPADIRERHLPKARRYADLWEELIQGAVDAGELRSTVSPAIFRMLIVGGTIGGMGWFRWGLNWQDAKEHLTPAEIAEEMISILFDGAAG